MTFIMHDVIDLTFLFAIIMIYAEERILDNRKVFLTGFAQCPVVRQAVNSDTGGEFICFSQILWRQYIIRQKKIHTKIVSGD